MTVADVLLPSEHQAISNNFTNSSVTRVSYKCYCYAMYVYHISIIEKQQL